MSEKVIHEIRVVETEDGFRIEIKGDKERLREMGFDKGFPFGFGRMGMGHGQFHHRGGHRGPRGFGFPFGRRFGPWWGDEENPKEKNETTA